MESSSTTLALTENTSPDCKSIIYVGNLFSGVTEADLMEVFHLYGPPTSIQLYRKPNSPCFAYVRFPSEEDAVKAVKEKKHSYLQAMQMRIMPAFPMGNDLTENTDANVFVKKLHSSIDGKKLDDIFSAYGTVISCKVCTLNGCSRGYGYVQYSKKEEAEAAINSKIVAFGRELFLSKFLKRGEREKTKPPCRNLYVKNLENWITDGQLKAEFSVYGNVDNAVVMKDEKGNSKCFGFVSFVSSKEAEIALASANGRRIGTKRIYVSKAQTRAERQKILNSQVADRLHSFTMSGKKSHLYFVNVDGNYSEAQIRSLLRGYGKVQSLSMFQGTQFDTPEQNSVANYYPNISVPQHYYPIYNQVPDYRAFETFNYCRGINRAPQYRY